MSRIPFPLSELVFIRPPLAVLAEFRLDGAYGPRLRAMGRDGAGAETGEVPGAVAVAWSRRV